MSSQAKCINVFYASRFSSKISDDYTCLIASIISWTLIFQRAWFFKR